MQMMEHIRGKALLIIFFCAFIWMGGGIYGKESKESIYEAYCENVKVAQKTTARVHYDLQRMYSSQVTEPIKLEMESIYGIPKEDEVYNIAEPVFMRSLAYLSWDALIDGQKMTCIQKLLNSNTTFTDTNPAYENQNGKNLKLLQSDTEQETRLTIYPLESSKANSELEFIIPPEIVSWHYPPTLWYPSPEQIGFPDTLKNVEMNQMEKSGPYGFIYTPQNLDSQLISYLARASLNPNIEEEDLTCVLMVDYTSHACQSFAITTMAEGQKRTLLVISNMGFIQTQFGLPLPRTTILNTSMVVDKDGNREKNFVNYFCQLNLQGFTLR